jgi:hypothetical protein
MASTSQRRLEGIAKLDAICLAASRIPPSPQTIKINGGVREASAFAGPTNPPLRLLHEADRLLERAALVSSP